MIKRFEINGIIKWMKSDYTKSNRFRTRIMIIPPSSKFFSKKTDFITFWGDIAQEVAERCKLNEIIYGEGDIQTLYSASSSKIILTGKAFKTAQEILALSLLKS